MMKKRFIKVTAITICLLLVSGCGRTGQDVLSLMPRPSSSTGWQWDFEPEIYTPDTLFEYINGEAEHYNDYHFMEMATASHVRTDDELASYTIDIYDMGTPLNAFGIYSSYRRPELEFAAIGEEAIVSALNVRFYKGHFFIQLSAGSMDEVVTGAIREQASRLASRIRAAQEPAELSFLPRSGQLPRTLQYLMRGFLGQAAFERALRASYRLPSGECSAFIVLKESGEDARQALNEFRESLSRQGQLIGDTGESDSDRFVAQTQYYGNITTLAHSRFVVGIVDYQEQAEAEELLSRIIASL